MPTTPTDEYRGEDRCSLARAVGVVGERWTFFVVREALGGTTRFSDFRRALGIAPDVLTARLQTLVDAGLMERREYREPGSRARASYHLVDGGRELALAIAALQEWGDRWTPSPVPTSVTFTGPDGPVRAAFVDAEGREVRPAQVRPVRAPAPADDVR